ncbi:TPA: PilN family type IVB pilus formation outer membrane protein [Klebsiella oxytoca]|nr:PilN family type IVB pilus formation outer membrane protein [Klebsiella oxytoca]
MTLFRISVTAVMIAATLSGCATREFSRADEQADRDISHARLLHERSRTQPTTPSLVWLDDMWVNPRPLRVSQRAQASTLPACSVTLAIDGIITLHEAGQRITRSCGLPVVITPDVPGASGISGGGRTQLMQGTLPRPDEGGRPALASLGSPVSSPVVSSGGTLSGIDWQGPLGGLLDQIASRLGISWRYDDGRVVFHYLDTRTFRLKVLNAETSMNASLTGTTSATAGENTNTGGSQDSGQSTTVKLESNIHNDIAASVKAMVSPAGNWHLSGSTGELIVTDVPQVLDRIARYIDNLNIRMNRMVRLKVSAYSVRRQDTSQTALDWNAVISRLDRFGASLVGAATASEQIASAQINVLNGRFAGTSALLRALESQGKTSMTLYHEAVTTNLVPAPVQVATPLVYLKKQDTTVSDSYATTTLEPGSITTGTQMTLLPDIRDEGDIQLQFNFSHSDPAQLRKIESDDGNTKMEMPMTSVRNLSERVNLRPGQTLIVTGYNARNLSVNREGTLVPDNTILGGGKSSDQDNTVLVIAITPELM